MPNKVAVDQQAKGMIIELGLLIRDCRGTLSQSQLAKRVGLPRSNMKYIEDGVNAPTAEVYDKLIKELKELDIGFKKAFKNLKPKKDGKDKSGKKDRSVKFSIS